MKKILFTVFTVFTIVHGFSQTKMSCCAKPTATKQFAMLASSKKFIMAHRAPLKYHFQSTIAKSITYKTPDGKESTAMEWKAKSPTANYLFVIHEFWGLNDFVKKESEKLYGDIGHVNVIALDLYDGQVTADRAEAGKLMQNVKEDRAQAIIKGAIAYAGPKAHIATIGWCFGGGWSLQSALLAGKQLTGCVMYYGMPEQDINKLKTLNADVLGNFANKDQWINPGVVSKFAANMKTAGKKLYLHQFDADHAFANPSNPAYNNQAAKDAYAFSLEFLKDRLK